jgi:O-antigen polysaccharide polymerase Wzy
VRNLSNQIVVLECLLSLCIVSAAVLLVSTDIIRVNGCIWIAVGLLLGLFLLSWRYFDNGRHPCFLFLGMLLVFQAGRLIAFVFGVLELPMQIVVQAPSPISISAHSAEVTLLAIILSALAIYFPCALVYKPTSLTVEMSPNWLSALYLVISLVVPFSFYKGFVYLMYLRAHGGYLAIYTNNSEVLAQAGFVVRSIALLGPTALIVAYIFETRKSMARLALILYIMLASLDLIIGMRGKFFSEIVTMWYLHNLKFNKRFHLLGLMVGASSASLLASWIAAFREERVFDLLSPAGFLALQGVSMNVTEAAVAFHHSFSRFALNYLLGGFWNGIHPTGTLEQGHLWTTDLSMFLNPAATRLGYGTASSYLAELFLLAGIPAVVLGSVVIGSVLAALHRLSSNGWGAVAMGLVLPSLLYLPRLELLDPVASMLKGLISLAIVLALTLLFRGVLRMSSLVVNKSSREK